jgi:ABC-type uncharacterized transport system fused permease/ATPase subunit
MSSSPAIQAMKVACASIGSVPLNDPHQLAAKLWELSIDYFEIVRRQAQQSFRSALWFSVAGTIFFFLALALMMRGQVPFSRLTLVAGVIVQVISAINFYLYAKTARQFAAFHACLERANRFLLANSLCEHLGNSKDGMRAELIRIIANAPLLSSDLVEHAMPRADSAND